MITAHGGALGTGRNTYKYFETIKDYGMEAIEIDIRSLCGKLYLGHVAVPLNPAKRIPLEYVFKFCVEHKLRVNCDVKRSGLVKRVVELAAELSATEYVYFTGAVSAKDIPYLGDCDAYMNNSFYSYRLTEENLDKIKGYLDSFGTPHIKGLNVNYKLTDEKLRDAIVARGMGLSVFTVDNEDELKVIVNKGYDNVTTNKPDKALEFRGY